MLLKFSTAFLFAVMACLSSIFSNFLSACLFSPSVCHEIYSSSAALYSPLEQQMCSIISLCKYFYLKDTSLSYNAFLMFSCKIDLLTENPNSTLAFTINNILNLI